MLQKRKKIELEHVTKEFDLYKRKSDKIKSLFAFWRKNIPTFWALRGVDLDINEGECVGIIGLNGSGKSTLSNIIAGVIPPTTGSAAVHGEASILAIGAGFKPALTGRENIHMRLLMLGKKESYIKEVTPEIIDFADIGEFIDQPLKSYSSGMKSRLGFGVEVYSNPDVFVIDEALSVGDQTFADKCAIKINELKAEGKTIIVVSHSTAQIQQLCDRTIWMHYGEMKCVGETKEVLDKYRAFIKEFNARSEREKKEYQAEQKRAQRMFDLQSYKKSLVDSKVELAPKKRMIVKKIDRQVNDLFERKNEDKMTGFTKSILILLLGVITVLSIYYILNTNVKILVKNDFISNNHTMIQEIKVQKHM